MYAMVFGDTRENVDEVNSPRFSFSVYLPLDFRTEKHKAKNIFINSKQFIIMNKTLRIFLLTLLLCGFMQTMADRWTDSNGLTWSFTVNGTEATDLRFYSGPDSKKIYIYGDPNRSEEEIAADPQLPFVPGAWDAAAMRFSDTEGSHLPTIPDEVYFGLKTLILTYQMLVMILT